LGKSQNVRRAFGREREAPSSKLKAQNKLQGPRSKLQIAHRSPVLEFAA
jgi:hypothetical protein